MAQTDSMSAERAVYDLFAKFDALDSEGLKNLLAEDGQGIDEIARKWIRSKAAIEEYLGTLAASVSNVKSNLSDLHVAEYGDFAIATCWLDQDYTMDGQPQHVNAPTTVVMRRDDGTWKAVLIHSIPLPDDDTA